MKNVIKHNYRTHIFIYHQLVFFLEKIPRVPERTPFHQKELPNEDGAGDEDEELAEGASAGDEESSEQDDAASAESIEF